MAKPEIHYHKTASKIKDAISSKLFGKPCYKVNKKAFCCFFEDEMVFKLDGKLHEEALQLAGSKLFDPSKKGRAMKAWVQVSFQNKNSWDKFAKAAADFVGS